MGKFSPKIDGFAAELWVVSHNTVVKLRMALAVLVVVAAVYFYIQQEAEQKQAAEFAVLLENRDAGFEGDAATSEAEPIATPPLVGPRFTVTLANSAEAYYLRPIDEDGSDRAYAPLVTTASAGIAHYDPWLSRAAREIAVQGAILGASPPEPVLSFILRSSGAPEGSVAQMLVQMRGDDPEAAMHAIEGALQSAPQGPGQLIVGVGEAAIEDGKWDRRLVVITARRDFELSSTKRQLERGETWSIAGRGPSEFGSATASVLYPDNSIVVLPVDMRGRDFSLHVPAGDLVGTVRVSIDGVGVRGPGKLLQLQAEVGRPLPTAIEVILPPDEDFPDLAAAEQYAFERLNYDRVSEGLAPLVLDNALSDVARAHSMDMRDAEYFAHLSPTTGLASDRLRRAEYGATSSGENLAFNDSIAEAQSSLMESVGHRRNLVSTTFTHVGIGLAREVNDSGESSWHLTQVFARKVQALDPEEAASELLAGINAGRLDRGHGELEMRDELSALAKEGCEQALLDELEAVPSAIAPRASQIIHGRVSVSAHAFYELDSLDLVEIGAEEEFRQIGLALMRDPSSLEGRTYLVIVFAEPS